MLKLFIKAYNYSEMPTTLNDILRGLEGNNLPVAGMSTRTIERRTATPVSVEYYFDILDANSPRPIDSQIFSIRQSYENSGDDTFLPYEVEDMDEAIDLCRQFCQNKNTTFTPNDEVEVRRKSNSNRIFLLIIERVIYTL